MIEKNIFAHKLFLSLNIADFNLFYVKIATPPEKSHPLFPSNPPLSEEGGAHYVNLEYKQSFHTAIKAMLL